ncbi:MAG: hypothetical protein JWQ87_2636 [Candidatus Sulfotelmatobacter sp.]|nr:hypothetical protein [Candidatus Sulfotelmatobacter sp.]
MHLFTTDITSRVSSEPSVSRSQNAFAPTQPVAAINRAEGRPIVRSIKELHLHPALERVGWSGLVEEFNDAARPANRIQDPILIATDGTILTGFGRWQLAVFEQTPEIYCIEHSLSADDSLAFILIHHQTQRGWNAFVRTRLALTMKPSLQEAAVKNMRLGGKYKGLANLPEAHPIDVRQQVADIAGVCPRNVGNVETILEVAHPTLIQALGNGTLKINRAIQFCKLRRGEQVVEFIRYTEERATSKAIRRCLGQPQKGDISLDPNKVLQALHSREGLCFESILVRIGRHKRTVILVGQDLLSEINQKELALK